MSQETAAQETFPSRTLQEVIKEAQRIEERTQLTSKGHFKAAGVWANVHLLIGIPTVVLAAVASALIHSSTNKPEIAVGVISVLVAALTAVQTFLNPSERQQKHLVAGNHYASLENRVRIFRTIECWQKGYADADAALTARMHHFSDEDDKLKQSSPQLPEWAYWIAKRAVARGETSYEIDKRPDNA